MLNEEDYVEIALACADVSNSLDRGINGKRAGELNETVLDAIEKLTS
jgi:hypothetical protein